jgi:Surface adhesin CshA repetitive domain/HYR domain
MKTTVQIPNFFQSLKLFNLLDVCFKIVKNRKFLKTSFASLFFFIFCTQFPAYSQDKFQCGQYVTRQVSEGSNFKSQISLLFNNSGTVGLTPVCENTSFLWNGAVFYDGYIYAWRQFPGVSQSGGTSTLCRINGDCSVTTYATNVPEGSYNNAYVDNNGNYYLGSVTTNNNISTFTIYKINLTTLTGGTNNATTITVTASAGNPAFTNSTAGIGDMYFDGTNAYIWLNGGPVSGGGNQGLARIDYTSATTGTYTRIGSGDRVSGSLFSNSNEPLFLFGYGSAAGTAGPQDRIIKISLLTGAATDEATGGIAVSQSDGAGCSSSTFETPNPIANPNQICKTRGTNIAGSTVVFDGIASNPPIVTANDQAFGFIANTANPSIINTATVEFTGPGVLSNANKTMTIAGQGVWTVTNTGIVTFTPEAGFAIAGGNPTAANYIVKDSNDKLSNETAITITYSGPPVFTNCPAPQNLGCNPTGIPNPLDLEVTGGTVTNNSLGPITTVGLCGRTQTRTYTATDACGGTATCQQVFTWTIDTTPPTASNPIDLNLACNATIPSPNTSLVIDEADACGTPTVTWLNDGTPTLVGCQETTIRTYRVADGCGNTKDVFQNIIRIVDLVPPTISCDDNVVSENPQATTCTYQKVLTPTVEDNCSSSNQITITYSLSGATVAASSPVTSSAVTFNKGITTVTYTATDLCGNSSTCSFLVTVRCESNIVCTFWSEDYAGENLNPTCSEFGPVAIQNAMLSALGGNPFTFGSLTNGFQLTPLNITSGDINNLLANGIFPLPGSSTALVAGISNSSSNNTSITGGVIQNPLLVRTIALYFNLQNSIALDNIEITNNMWTRLVNCDTGIPFGPNILTQMPASVVSYLFNANNGYPRTVQGLFNLANDVLGGKNLGMPSTFVPTINEIKIAVEKINGAFRNCAVLVAPNINATGNLFYDLDGMSDGIMDGNPGAILDGSASGQAGVQLYLTLIEGNQKDIDGNNTGAILKVAPITNVGTYLFDPVVAGTYTINLGFDPAGSRKPSLPAGKIFSGDGGRLSQLGDLDGNGVQLPIGFAVGDGNPNGRIELVATTNTVTYIQGARAAAPMADLTDINFAISNGPLPVRLVSFDGKSITNGNELNWKTSTEQNFSHYEIERSYDAKSFKMIGKIAGSGSTKETLSYNYFDNTALNPNNSKSVYYRLRMVDLNGSFEYSKIIFVENKIENTASVGNFYPNPAFGNEVTINVTSSANMQWTITGYSLAGKIISTETRLLEKGENKLRLKLGENSPKVSIYRFESTDGIQYRKLNK